MKHTQVSSSLERSYKPPPIQTSYYRVYSTTSHSSPANLQCNCKDCQIPSLPCAFVVLSNPLVQLSEGTLKLQHQRWTYTGRRRSEVRVARMTGNVHFNSPFWGHPPFQTCIVPPSGVARAPSGRAPPPRWRLKRKYKGLSWSFSKLPCGGVARSRNRGSDVYS